MNNIEDLTLFSVEKDIESKKVIHFLGYGYRADVSEKPYRFIEYTFFYAPIKQIMEEGFSNVESRYNQEIKQYVSELNESEFLECYGRYYNKKKTKRITQKDFNECLKEGTYLFIPEWRD